MSGEEFPEEVERRTGWRSRVARSHRSTPLPPIVAAPVEQFVINLDPSVNATTQARIAEALSADDWDLPEWEQDVMAALAYLPSSEIIRVAVQLGKGLREAQQKAENLTNAVRDGAEAARALARALEDA